jgi:hypothetical protein
MQICVMLAEPSEEAERRVQPRQYMDFTSQRAIF